ncbi:Sir2 family protein [Pleurostoma richardsiae]|uniref:Sir2 family protein n=1 Tax=Pleurostoma richardsiae TaxID=41990 RepID=A0AA38VIU3_9PEZI|nr:Sir2 family protein [Pleurostoma richardsiae]
MRKPLMRIPYTDVFAPPTVIPSSAKSLSGAVAALQEFLTAPPRRGLPASAVVLSGAGLSVASGLADYRGDKGTYRVNKTYRPIYYHEFLGNHEARKRYWARSFLGWPTLHKAKPNAGHFAVRDLGDLGLVRSVITQNVDSFHPTAHPHIPTLELHGYLRSVMCTSCHNEFPRDTFQEQLARLNPIWADFLAEAIASGALDTDNPTEQRARGIRSNPDGDVDLPDAPYTTFRYPACPRCLSNPPLTPEGTHHHVVEVDHEGAWKPGSTAGVLKPAVIMFGESIPSRVKVAAEEAIDQAGRLLVLATSLATYSAWRLVKKAHDRGMPIAVVNMGGVRGEETFLVGMDPQQGAGGVRIDMSAQNVLPALVATLRASPSTHGPGHEHSVRLENGGAGVFKDMLS